MRPALQAPVLIRRGRTRSIPLERGRGRADDLDLFAARRVGEADLPGVEKIAGRARGRGPFVVDAVGAWEPARPVERIADERASGESEMDPYLVRATRGDGHLEERLAPVGKPPDDTDMAYRRPSVRAIGVDGRRQRVRDRPDRRVDRERLRHPRPRGQGQVDLEDAALEHGRRQEAGGRAVAREKDGSGRAAAEPVERRADGAVALADQVEQSVLQEEAAGQDGQAGGLRQDEDVIVLVERHEFPWRVGLIPGQAVIDEARRPGSRRSSGEASSPFRGTWPASIFRRHSASVE
ncbi:MAG: hypothetical protein MZV63_65285 [Marinilabiliales bacterium]|nr:hypothetical protein [Marinilabiliales bacterium]